MLYYIVQKNLCVDSFALVFDCQMKMGSGRAARVACDGNGSSRFDEHTFGDDYSGKMTIADGVVAVTQDDEIAGTFVEADAVNDSIEHGIAQFVVSTEVNAVVELAFGSERVLTIAKGRSDVDVLEWRG